MEDIILTLHIFNKQNSIGFKDNNVDNCYLIYHVDRHVFKLNIGSDTNMNSVNPQL